ESVPRHSQHWLAADLDTWIARTASLAAAVWLCGVVALSWRWVSRQRQLLRLTASLQRASIEPSVSTDVRRRLGLSNLPNVAVSAVAPMPMVVGWRRPVVVLPDFLVAAASAARIRDV